jgi:uracil-DNA glycosylase family 4
MPDQFQQLLSATIQHLEELKGRGVRFVTVSPSRIAEVSRMPRSGRVANPAVFQPVKPEPARAPQPTSVPAAAKSVVKPPEPRPLVSSAGTIQPAPLASEAKLAAFNELRQRALACIKCPHLASSRKNVVFGVGNIDAELMFVGEAPGADEDTQGEPFVGRAGDLLTKIIEGMGLQRGSVYIGNILKCRPDTPGQTAGNRKPTAEEMQTCIPFLHEQIDLIRPKALVALGGTAIEGLLGKTAGIMRLRGNWQVYRGIPLMPTFHPAYVLRNPAMSVKRQVWEDMLQVMEKLQMPISEKQQNFFLKSK